MCSDKNICQDITGNIIGIVKKILHTTFDTCSECKYR